MSSIPTPGGVPTSRFNISRWALEHQWDLRSPRHREGGLDVLHGSMNGRLLVSNSRARH